MVESMQHCAHTSVKNMHNVIRTSDSEVFTTGVKLEVFDIFAM